MTTRACELDHLVVTSPTLEAGVKWLQEALGVAPQAGGDHQRMGTHNALVRLGGATYVEVIASNPAAPPPRRPRWFELDCMTPAATPRLATWVARTDDIKSTVADCPSQFGAIEPMSRGPLNWLIPFRLTAAFPAAASSRLSSSGRPRSIRQAASKNRAVR